MRRLSIPLLLLAMVASPVFAEPSSQIPADATRRPDLGNEKSPVWVKGTSLFVFVGKGQGPQVAAVPRLPCRLKHLSWLGREPDTTLTLRPEPNEWRIEAKSPPTEDAILVMELLDPVPASLKLPTVGANDAGIIELPAHFAATHGRTLRFEPQPHKNTIGYWSNPQDWAAWTLNVDRPGPYRLTVHQGCGTGQGGSDVDVVIVSAGDDAKPLATVPFVVEETGHFQKFHPRNLGTVKFPAAGAYRLEIRPRKLARNAVMDVRLVTLTPVENR